MQSDLSAASRSPRLTTENNSDLRADQLDTRRFGSVFHFDAPNAVSVKRNDATCEESGNDSDDDTSRWQLIATLDETLAAHAQVETSANVDEHASLSAAQQIIACYRAVHGGDHAPDCASTEINESVSQVPDDQRSMYTIATPVDTRSKMDMMWKPQPKVHMHRADKRALIQAQCQAIAMMHDAGLEPTNKIQCCRRGCADILPGIGALKYHLHIHNIADIVAKCDDDNASRSTACESSPVQLGISNPRSLKRHHSRSKSSAGIQNKSSTLHFPARKLSVGSPLPSHLSPCEHAPDAQREHVPSLAGVAMSFITDFKSDDHPLKRNNNEAPCTNVMTLARGRRLRKESTVRSICADSPSIAMLLSSPSPNTRGRLSSVPHTPFSISLPLGPTTGDVNDGHAIVQNEDAHQVPEKLRGSRSPIRALSPTRALSPIRDGIRRVLSLGYSADTSE